ncbi:MULTISPECIES: hypothetical protein [unclassified Agarivorans]|uniref:hypothetical protein n=1 Tax=unclassified Agarivorans TaxID=2636026 RepID=UPI003D7E117A
MERSIKLFETYRPDNRTSLPFGFVISKGSSIALLLALSSPRIAFSGGLSLVLVEFDFTR